jgi:hypothetical protein
LAPIPDLILGRGRADRLPGCREVKFGFILANPDILGSTEKNRFHTPGGWITPVVAFLFMFSLGAVPVGLRNLHRESESRKRRRPADRPWQWFDPPRPPWPTSSSRGRARRLLCLPQPGCSCRPAPVPQARWRPPEAVMAPTSKSISCWRHRAKPLRSISGPSAHDYLEHSADAPDPGGGRIPSMGISSGCTRRRLDDAR